MDAGVLRAGDRLPWLEPYRPPSRRPSNRKAGIAALVGVAGLAGIATLLAVRTWKRWRLPPRSHHPSGHRPGRSTLRHRRPGSARR